ncbi:MAG: metallophosphoesterase family protein [Thermomicrobiales bacterium]
MRIALISDIHGNCGALDAVLEDLGGRSVERMVCLGDAIQGGPRPAETVARLREMGCPVVMGNADAWLLTGEETGAEKPATERMRAIRAWQLEQLSAEDQAFVAAFVPTVEVELPDGRLLLCFHGSPDSFDDIILPTTPDDEARRLLGESGAAVFTGGHTHLQQVRRFGDALFVNPGSVGFAFDRHQPEDNFQADHWAECAVLSVENGRFGLEFRRVPFDVAAVVRQAFDGGMPEPDAFAARYQGRDGGGGA